MAGKAATHYLLRHLAVRLIDCRRHVTWICDEAELDPSCWCLVHSRLCPSALLGQASLSDVQ